MTDISIIECNRILTLEKHAEHQALAAVRGATFTECLKLCGVAPEIAVQSPQGKVVTIHGSDISDRKTWHKFLASINQNQMVDRLTGRGEDIAEQYNIWLLKKHTDRYRLITSANDLAWLQHVVRLAVARYIMQQKYHAYTTLQQASFADAGVAIEMGHLQQLNSIPKELARMVHHAVKDAAHAQQLLEQFYAEHYRQERTLPLLTRESLPALPPGVTSPFLQLNQQVESQGAEHE